MLVVNPVEQIKLRQELKKLESPYDLGLLRPLHHLNGCIEETLRLFPCISTKGYRKTGPEGLTVGQTHDPTSSDLYFAMTRRNAVSSSPIKPAA